MSKSSKDPGYLRQVKDREDKRKAKLRAVVTQSLRHLNSEAGLENAKQVQESVKVRDGIEVNIRYVCAVLHHDVRARYKKVKKIPPLGNTSRCLQLRQRYAEFLLNRLAGGMRVINLDQTWINDTSYRQRKWR